jgi:ribosomal protein S18 acetylase RimI-like enzyme
MSEATAKTTGVSIRVAAPADADEMARLHYKSHVESFASFVPEEWVRTRDLEAYRGRWVRTLSQVDSRNCAWVAEVGGQVVGMVQVYQLEGTRAELSSMHVRPGLMGRGIGALLMDAAMTFIRDAGYREARLGVVAANERARRFYERFGWHECHYQEVGVEGVPVYHYCLELSQDAGAH